MILIKSMEVVQLEDKVELIQFFTHIKILKMIYIKDLEIIIMVEQYIQQIIAQYMVKDMMKVDITIFMEVVKQEALIMAFIINILIFSK